MLLVLDISIIGRKILPLKKCSFKWSIFSVEILSEISESSGLFHCVLTLTSWLISIIHFKESKVLCNSGQCCNIWHRNSLFKSSIDSSCCDNDDLLTAVNFDETMIKLKVASSTFWGDEIQCLFWQIQNYHFLLLWTSSHTLLNVLTSGIIITRV